MSAPQAVLFDLGGVLLPFDQGRRVRAVAQALAIDEAAALGALEPALFARLDIGEADEADFAAAFSRASGRPVGVDEARALILSVFEAPNAQLWAVAARLAERIQVGGFSDNPAFVRERFPAGAQLAPMFWSAELGVTKASEAAFAHVEGELACAPGAIVFIDDTAANVATARRRGWDAIQFSSNAALTDALAARGLA